jgi:hypothetical protein
VQPKNKISRQAKKSFTLFDAFAQFWFVLNGGDRRSLTCAGLTYFYLVNLWNTCGRPATFRRQNTIIIAELNISRPALSRHREILQKAGLINFYTRGYGDPNIEYQILEVKKNSFSSQREMEQNIPTDTAEMEQNVPTNVLTPVHTNDVYKQRKVKVKIERDASPLISLNKKNEIENFSTEEKEWFQKLLIWIEENASVVANMDEPLTIDQAIDLRNKYPGPSGETFLREIIKAIHNYGNPGRNAFYKIEKYISTEKDEGRLYLKNQSIQYRNKSINLIKKEQQHYQEPKKFIPTPEEEAARVEYYKVNKIKSA